RTASPPRAARRTYFRRKLRSACRGKKPHNRSCHSPFCLSTSRTIRGYFPVSSVLRQQSHADSVVSFRFPVRPHQAVDAVDGTQVALIRTLVFEHLGAVPSQKTPSFVIETCCAGVVVWFHHSAPLWLPCHTSSPFIAR